MHHVIVSPYIGMDLVALAVRGRARQSLQLLASRPARRLTAQRFRQDAARAAGVAWAH